MSFHNICFYGEIRKKYYRIITRYFLSSPLVYCMFLGIRCDTIVPACESNPCQNDAACIDDASPDKYTCMCRPGFSGKFLYVHV